MYFIATKVDGYLKAQSDTSASVTNENNVRFRETVMSALGSTWSI